MAKMPTTHINLPPALAAAVLAMQSDIDADDVVELENEPHVTIRYGCTNDVEAIRNAVAGFGEVSVVVGQGKIFRNDDSDTLVLSVASDDAFRLRAAIESLGAEPTPYTYTPHVTIAYLKPGAGEKYLPITEGFEISFKARQLTFSDADRNATSLPLTETIMENPLPIVPTMSDVPEISPQSNVTPVLSANEDDYKAGKPEESPPLLPSIDEQFDEQVGKLSTDELREAAANVDPAPTDSQKIAGTYRKGHVRWKGIPITIETAAGQTRSGTGADGKPWSVEMKDHYGYVKRTESEADGDHIDVFLSENNLDSDRVFVIDQHVGGKFDEHKCMLGCDDEDQARETYARNYSKNWNGIGGVKEMSVDEFKEWMKSGDTGRPVAVSKASYDHAEASDKADYSSAAANASNRPDLHAVAAKHHREAANLHAAAAQRGGGAGGEYHTSKADEHMAAARSHSQLAGETRAKVDPRKASGKAVAASQEAFRMDATSFAKSAPCHDAARRLHASAMIAHAETSEAYRGRREQLAQRMSGGKGFSDNDVRRERWLQGMETHHAAQASHHESMAADHARRAVAAQSLQQRIASVAAGKLPRGVNRAELLGKLQNRRANMEPVEKEARIPYQELVADGKDKPADEKETSDTQECEKFEASSAVEFTKSDEHPDYHYVMGPVLIPDEEDHQGDIVSKEEILQAAHSYMEDSQRPGLMHTKMLGSRDAKVVESYILPVDLVHKGRTIPAGTWMMGMRVYAEPLRDLIRKGMLKGYSIGGRGNRTPA